MNDEQIIQNNVNIAREKLLNYKSMILEVTDHVNKEFYISNEEMCINKMVTWANMIRTKNVSFYPLWESVRPLVSNITVLNCRFVRIHDIFNLMDLPSDEKYRSVFDKMWTEIQDPVFYRSSMYRQLLEIETFLASVVKILSSIFDSNIFASSIVSSVECASTIIASKSFIVCFVSASRRGVRNSPSFKVGIMIEKSGFAVIS